jgi:hypothetical protein
VSFFHHRPACLGTPPGIECGCEHSAREALNLRGELTPSEALAVAAYWGSAGRAASDATISGLMTDCSCCEQRIGTATSRYCQSCSTAKPTAKTTRADGRRRDLPKTECTKCETTIEAGVQRNCNACGMGDTDGDERGMHSKPISQVKGIAMTPKKALKTERHRAALGMSTSASADEVKAAWKQHKHAKRAAAVGYGPTATKDAIKMRETLLSSNNAEEVKARVAALRAKAGVA